IALRERMAHSMPFKEDVCEAMRRASADAQRAADAARSIERAASIWLDRRKRKGIPSSIGDRRAPKRVSSSNQQHRTQLRAPVFVVSPPDDDGDDDDVGAAVVEN